MSIGLLIGKYIVILKNKELIDHKNKNKNKNIISKSLSWIGKNSLEIYIVHWIILYIFFAHIYSKFHTNLDSSVTVS